MLPVTLRLYARGLLLFSWQMFPGRLTLQEERISLQGSLPFLTSTSH